MNVTDAAANAVRGEASLTIGEVDYRLRPSFTALVAAEDELGPLFALVERAGSGELRLSEIACLFWHCVEARGDLSRDAVGEAVMVMGLAKAAQPLRQVLQQILQGRA